MGAEFLDPDAVDEATAALKNQMDQKAQKQERQRRQRERRPPQRDAPPGGGDPAPPPLADAPPREPPAASSSSAQRRDIGAVDPSLTAVAAKQFMPPGWSITKDILRHARWQATWNAQNASVSKVWGPKTGLADKEARKFVVEAAWARYQRDFPDQVPPFNMVAL